jgi:hypothetical protein
MLLSWHEALSRCRTSLCAIFGSKLDEKALFRSSMFSLPTLATAVSQQVLSVLVCAVIHSCLSKS